MTGMPRTAGIVSGLDLTLAEDGEGQVALVLHGGGGPATVAGLASHLAVTMHAITPTHPGWNGTPRPDWLASIDDLALVYLHFLRGAGITDAVLVGSSLGGWLAAEMAARDAGGLIGGLVLINTVGIDVPGEPITDIATLSPRGLAEHAYHDPDRFFMDPASLPPERIAMQRRNQETVTALAGAPYMHDPRLRGRLRHVRAPTLVLWGESDRIATPAYGRAFAAALPRAQFEMIPEAGHLPHMEQPDATFAAIDRFVAELA